MNKCLLVVTLILFLWLPEGKAQSGLKQYFDGADTLPDKALLIIRDTAARNIWQIGPPRKTIFNSAATIPNAIVTDTLNAYPPNDTSRFVIKFNDSLLGYTHIIAVRWKQKLDLLPHHSGGVVEFSKNGGAWQNAFNNTANVYNFYGFMQANKDTLAGDLYAFSGLDTTWRDIWLCIRSVNTSDSFAVRYSLFTDTTTAGKEGWIIDNMLVQRTFIHTVAQVENNHDSKVYPTVTTGIVFVEAAHLSQQHFIKSITVTDAAGRVVQQYTDEQSRYMIDLSQHAPGEYFVKVITNLGSETFKVLRN